MIFIIIQRPVSDRRNKSSWIQVIIKYGNIVLVKIDKERKTEAKAAATLPRRDNLEFDLIRFSKEYLGNRLGKEQYSFAKRIQTIIFFSFHFFTKDFCR